MNVKLLGDRIAVQPLGKANNSSGGLLKLMDDDNNTGNVRYLGDEYKGSLKENSKVCYGNSFQKIKIQGQDLIIMDSANIFAILEEEELKGEKIS